MPLEPTSVPRATRSPQPPEYVPPVTPPSAPPPSGWLARLRGLRAGARNAAIGPGVVIEVAPGARLELGDGCAIGAGSRLHVRAGTVRIGPGAVVGERCALAAHAGIEIGPDAVLGDDAVIVDFDHRYDDADVPVRLQGLISAPVRIGAGARVGARAAIQRGVSVGEQAEVAALSVVTSDVPARARVGGSPAQPVRPAGTGTRGGSRSPRAR